MKKENIDSFEKSWQSAFEEAHLTPNSQIWENIEANLPPQLPTNTPTTGFNGLAKVATGIVALVGISTIIYLSNKESNQNLKVNHENSIQIEKPTALGAKLQQQKLVENAFKIASIKPLFIKKIVENQNIIIPVKTDNEVIKTEKENVIALIEEEKTNNKIEIIVTPLQNKHYKLEKVSFTPLEIANKNEAYVPYFENTQPIDSNSKGKFWDKFKVRAGFGIGIGTGTSNANGSKPKR